MSYEHLLSEDRDGVRVLTLNRRLGQSVLKTTADHAEGASAFLERRAPDWQAR